MAPAHRNDELAATPKPWEVDLIKHERDCTAKNDIGALKIELARLSTTIKVWGGVAVLAIAVLNVYGVLVVKGIVGEARSRTAEHDSPSLLMGTAHASPTDPVRDAGVR